MRYRPALLPIVAMATGVVKQSCVQVCFNNVPDQSVSLSNGPAVTDTGHSNRLQLEMGSARSSKCTMFILNDINVVTSVG